MDRVTLVKLFRLAFWISNAYIIPSMPYKSNDQSRVAYIYYISN